MNAIWLEDFLALARTLNFSRAAELRHITQPAFGRRIRALEEWCGHPLVDRSSHRLSLTGAGLLMQDAAQDLLRRTRQLERDLAALETHSTTLTFAATQALSFTFFPDWFRRTGAGAAVHLLAGNMRACEKLMEEGRAQFLLCHTHPLMQMALPAEHYRSRPLATDLLVPVSPTDAGGMPLFTLDGNGKEPVPFLGFDERSGLGRILQAGLSDQLSRLPLKPVFTSHVAMALKTMALEGRGIAWLPQGLVRDDVTAGRLAVIGAQPWQLEITVTLVRPRSRLSELAEEFWSRLSSSSQTLPAEPAP